MRQLSLAIVLLTTLAGCQLTHIEGVVDDVRVQVSTNDDDRYRSKSTYGRFCPPGQAKKGNC